MRLLDTVPASPSAPVATNPLYDDLSFRLGRLDGVELIAAAAFGPLGGKLALVSSFGTEAAVLLHMISRVDRDLPVIFLETGMLFPETLAYRDQLIDRLGLRNVRSETPDPLDHAREDPTDELWMTDTDRCCAFRKVRPLARALSQVDGWISGLKRHHGGGRAAVMPVERDGRRVKLNPLAFWDRDQVLAYFAANDLPRHPLEAQGYASIGCIPCTSRSRPGEGLRSGRWVGQGKTECGIHTMTGDGAGI
ncbi:phosphoadenylyl-sulfate reductase [Tistrella bauzanensis]|uniref:Adenosine 5'-phosphosulfate reductase n=1 Tax=Tistrella arctica TaxID=3133430 RepID=A0ABU9YD43_9PROT